MIDSVVFIKQDIEDVINYYLSISDSERIVENENIIVDNLLFKEKNDWTYIINLEGDAFSEEFLLELSKERVFLIWEAITHKPVPPEKEGMVHFIGLMFFMVLMVFLLFNDLVNIFG